MHDAEKTSDGGEGDRIVLAQVNEAYWMLEGEPYLNAMLSGLDPVPKPVRCLQFRTVFDLGLFLPVGQSLASLWGINPAIVDRLRRNDDLVVVEMPEDE